MRSIGCRGSRDIFMLLYSSITFQTQLCPQPLPTFIPPVLHLHIPALRNLNPYLPSWSVTHKGPWCLEPPPGRRPWIMKTVPTTMPTRPTASPRAQTTVSVSSDMGVGISGSVKVKLWRSECRRLIHMPVCKMGRKGWCWFYKDFVPCLGRIIVYH